MVPVPGKDSREVEKAERVIGEAGDRDAMDVPENNDKQNNNGE